MSAPVTKQLKYGGDVTTAQFVRLVFALSMGTLVEWFDFTLYTQLAPTITQLFFPQDDPAVAQLSFWAVYATGFVSRPAGSLLFGHIGDAYGRRASLLLSVLLITLPTLLVGVLPTYRQWGLAAPIIMALLRCLQGLALGGEFGTAIAWLHELGPEGHKGLSAALGQSATAPGVILGILMCEAVMYGCSHSQLMSWGWRIPFLLTAVTAPLAFVLRLHMPEAHEFMEDREAAVRRRVAGVAGDKVARACSLRQGSTSSSSALRPAALSRLVRGGDGGPGTAAAAAAAAALGRHASAPPEPPGGRLTARQLSLSLQRSFFAEWQDSGAAACGGPRTRADICCYSSPALAGRRTDEEAQQAGQQLSWQQQQQGTQDTTDTDKRCSGSLQEAASAGAQQLQGDAGALAAQLPPSCEEQFQAEVAQLSRVVRRHVPVAVLLRHHWLALLLQVLAEANFAVAFYVFYSYIAAYSSQTLRVPVANTLWAVMLGMALFAAVVGLTGHFVCDSRVPKAWALSGATAVIGALSLPVMMCIEATHELGMWLLQPLMLALCGIVGGLMTTIGPQTYPPAVRATGYNCGHSIAMTIGGLVPLIVSAMAKAAPPATTSAGILLVATAGLSCCAAVILAKVRPETNAACPAGQQRQHLAREAAARQRRLEQAARAKQLQQVVVVVVSAAPSA